MEESLQPRSGWSLITGGSFSRLWWASIVSSTGDWITIFATIALGNEIAGGQGVLVAIFARIVPGLVFGPAVGVLTDRFDRRRLIVIADIGRGLVVLLLVFAATLPILVMVTILSEFLSLLGQSPRAAIVPRLVHQVNIVNANSLILGATYGNHPARRRVQLHPVGAPSVDTRGADPGPDIRLCVGVRPRFADVFCLGPDRDNLAQARDEDCEGRAEPMATTCRHLQNRSLPVARFLIRTGSVRRVIFSIASALFGGGVVIAIGPTFVGEVLNADSTGFFCGRHDARARGRRRHRKHVVVLGHTDAA